MDRGSVLLIVGLQAVALALIVQRTGLTTSFQDWLHGAPAACGFWTHTEYLIYSRRVVTPSGVVEAAVHVQDGRIHRVVDSQELLDAQGISGLGGRLGLRHILDFQDLVVSPGLIDVHVHLNEPGRQDWEGVQSGTKAAAAGGVTMVVDMPLNSQPCTTTVEQLARKFRLAQDKAWVDIGFWAGLVPENAGDEAALQQMIDVGAIGFKAFMSPSGINDFPNVSVAHLERATHTLAGRGVPLMLHAELVHPLDERSASPPGPPQKYASYLATRPDSFETGAISAVLQLLRRLGQDLDGDGQEDLPRPESGFLIHLAHLGSAEALPMIRQAKREGLPLSVETCPHYLSFDADSIPDSMTEFKCAPPLRSPANRGLLQRALVGGGIDLVSSDHSPAPPSMKLKDSGDFLAAWGGISGMQYTLPAVWTCCGDAAAGGGPPDGPASRNQSQGLTLEDLARLLSEAPAALIQLDDRKGQIKQGYDADLVVWDPLSLADTSPQGCQHRHKITPYRGMKLTGRVRATFVRGQQVFDSQRGPVPQPCGEVVTRPHVLA